jgi:ribosomal protein L37AE/L43A
MFRYVCPNCLRTFLEKRKHFDWICHNCGEALIIIGPHGQERE